MYKPSDRAGRSFMIVAFKVHKVYLGFQGMHCASLFWRVLVSPCFPCLAAGLSSLAMDPRRHNTAFAPFRSLPALCYCVNSLTTVIMFMATAFLSFYSFCLLRFPHQRNNLFLGLRQHCRNLSATTSPESSKKKRFLSLFALPLLSSPIDT